MTDRKGAPCWRAVQSAAVGEPYIQKPSPVTSTTSRCAKPIFTPSAAPGLQPPALPGLRKVARSSAEAVQIVVHRVVAERVVHEHAVGIEQLADAMREVRRIDRRLVRDGLRVGACLVPA